MDANAPEAHLPRFQDHSLDPAEEASPAPVPTKPDAKEDSPSPVAATDSASLGKQNLSNTRDDTKLTERKPEDTKTPPPEPEENMLFAKKKTKKGKLLLDENAVRTSVLEVFEKINKAVTEDDTLIMTGKPGRLISSLETDSPSAG
jgi:hypothetical protein